MDFRIKIKIPFKSECANLFAISGILFLLLITIVFYPELTFILRSNLTSEQKAHVISIQFEGRKAGLGKSDLEQIYEFDENLCYEVECLQSALEILRAVNFSENPCEPEGWLEFACGRRVRGNDIWGQFSKVQQYSFWSTLELLLQETTDPNEYLLPEAKHYFQQCVEKGSQQQNVLDILEYTNKHGGWPLLTRESFSNKEYPWLDIVADQNRFRIEGFKPLLFEVSLSDNGALIQLDVGRLSLSDSGEYFQDYVELIKRIIPEENSDAETAEAEVRAAFEFLFHLNITLGNLFPRGTDYKRMELTLTSFQEMTDSINRLKGLPIKANWTRFFGRVFAGTNIDLEVEAVPVISVPFSAVMMILEYVEQEMNGPREMERIANALQLNLISMLVQETTFLTDDLKTFTDRNETDLTRTHNCYKRTTEIFGYSLGKTFLSRYYNGSTVEPYVHRLMGDVKESLFSILDSPPWTTNLTTYDKEQLQDRVANINITIAQPDWLRERGKLQEFYEGFPFSTKTNSSYACIFLEVNRWQVAKERSWRRNYIDAYGRREIGLFETDWNYYLGKAGAHYTLPTNAVYLLAGLFQTPLFGIGRPGFMNYGSLAVILGHEIGHSIINGAMFDEIESNPAEFGAHSRSRIFDKWVNGMAEFYKRDNLDNADDDNSTKPLMSGDTMTEDLSDLLGLHAGFVAYEGYLEELDKSGRKEKVLPGLGSISPQQLFFIKYANMWCESQALETTQLSRHSHPNTRANLPVRFSQEFKHAFHCT